MEKYLYVYLLPLHAKTDEPIKMKFGMDNWRYFETQGMT